MLSDLTKSTIRLALRAEIQSAHERCHGPHSTPDDFAYFHNKMQDLIRAYEEFTGETYVHFS